MKGEIFNIFEQFVSENFGADTFDQVHESAMPQLITKEPFVGPGTYPDEDFFTLVTGTVAHLQLQLGGAVRAFGKYSFAKLARKVEHHIKGVSHPKDLLHILDGLVHVEVRKVYAGARPPRFTVLSMRDDYIKMRYESQRKLYDFVEGIIEGAAEYYGYTANITRALVDAEQGVCDFEISFVKRG